MNASINFSKEKDPTDILDAGVELLLDYSRTIREQELSQKQRLEMFSEIQKVHQKTLDNYLENFNVKDHNKATELNIRFNMLFQENMATLFQTESAWLKKEDDGNFKNQVKNHLIDIAPRLSQYDYIPDIEYVENKDVAVARFTTENGSSYGFDTIYLAWKDRTGEIQHRELLNSRENKDYININEVSLESDLLKISLKSGGSFSGQLWEEKFDVALRDLGVLRGSNTTESLKTQIEKMFPQKNAQALEQILVSLDKQIEGLEKAADNTYTGFVVSFEVDGKKIYAKGSNDILGLKKEVEFSKNALNHPLMRPITPKLLGFSQEDGLGVILTYGTENEGIIENNDIHNYLRTRMSVFSQYAKRNNINLDDMLTDTAAIDVFNRAVSHTFMKDYKDNSVFLQNKSPLVIPFPMLLDRASKTKDKDLFNFVRGQENTYHEALLNFYETDSISAQQSLLCFDGRPENVFLEKTGYNLRPAGDMAFARNGPVTFDIARLETGNDSVYASLYAFARNKLEQEAGNDFELGDEDVRVLQKGTVPLSYINLVRTISSKLSRNSIADAQRYKNLINSHQYAVK